MLTRSLNRTATLLVSLAAVLTSSLAGQDRVPKRTLGGHNFVPIELLGDPFTGTYVRNSTGGGTAVGLKLGIPDLEGGTVGIAEANIGFLTLGLEYQQNITHWLALRIGGSGGARLGTSIEALLAEGATAVFGFHFGATAQVIRAERFALNASVDVIPNKAYGISPLDFARSVIDNGLDSASSLLKKANGRHIFLGLRPAYALTPWLGLMGQFEFGPAKARTDEEVEEEEEEQKETQLAFGLGASINLAGASGTPIGFTVAYQHKTGLIGQGDVSGGADSWNAGIFYTGRRNFIVGLDILASSIGQTLSEDDISLVGARLTLRYDFK
jgi:hypothetical protein